MADIQFPPSHLNQRAKVMKSAYFCYFLAALVMIVTAWFIVEGIQATEPDSPARNGKIAGGVLLLLLEGCVFSLAGHHLRHSLILRTLGWSVFVLQIVLMSLAQIAIGTTAGKAAQISTATVEEIRAQADASRSAAKSLQADAARMRNSKHAWKRDEAGQKSDTAAAAVAAASGTVEQLEKLKTASVSTPIIEIIGNKGLIALSIAFSVIMEAAGIVLMHVAGSLRREASGGLPIDVQILELLHRVHGVPSSAALQAAPQLAHSPGALEAAPQPAIASKPTATVKPIYSSWTGKGIPLATFGALSALSAAQTVQAAPAASPINVDRSAASAPVNVNPSAPVNVYPPAAATPVNVDPFAPVTKARKARVARDGAVMDTGVGEHDGYRYRRALAGVKGRTIRPSRDGLFTAVGASPPTAKRYLEAMALAGEIVPAPSGRGWVVSAKNGGAA